MASGPMHLTLSMPDLLAQAGRAKEAAKAAGAEFKRLQGEMQTAQRLGQQVKPQTIDALNRMDRIRVAQRQVLRDEQRVKAAVQDVKVLQTIAGARFVRDLLSGKADVASLAQDAALLASSSAGRKALARVGVPKVVTSNLANVSIATAVAQAGFELGSFGGEAIAKALDKRAGFLARDARTQMMETAVENVIGPEAMETVKNANFYKRDKDGKIISGYNDADEQAKATVEGLKNIAKGRNYAEEILGLSDEEIAKSAGKELGNISLGDRQAIIDSLLAEINPADLAKKVREHEAKADAQRDQERRLELRKTPTDRWRERERDRMAEIQFQIRRGVVPVRYGD